jgi:acyl-coenzyme A thioesterase PaaI-like protein
MTMINPDDLRTIPRIPGGPMLCFGCQASARCRFGVRSFTFDRRDNTYSADIYCGSEHEGGPRVAHGGWVASVLDEVLGIACCEATGQLSVTASLGVSYQRPTPIEEVLRIEGKVDNITSDRAHSSGTLMLASTGATLAKGTGLWAIRPPGHFDRQQEWLTSQHAKAASRDQEPT